MAANPSFTAASNSAKAGIWLSALPVSWVRSCLKIVSAPALLETSLKPSSKIQTPAVKLLNTVSKNDLDSCSEVRVSASCRVMTLNWRVNMPSSSPVSSSGLGERSPCATACVPRSSMSSGRANCPPSNRASVTATNKAKNRVSVRVPMYIWRRPVRPKDFSW